MQPMHKVNIVILALLYNNLEEIYLPYRFNVTRLLMELSYCVLVWEKIYKEKMRYLLSVLIFCGLVLLRVDTHIHMKRSWWSMPPWSSAKMKTNVTFSYDDNFYLY